MCGLAGFLNYPDHVAYARSACMLQQHRGPDSQDIWTEGPISLAHQRLSIIDVDARSDQPMVKDRYVMVYNGEIYNYRELKARLEREHGVTFRTNSDTEVVLESYRLKGPKCLDDFIGMFALAIYDRDRKELFLARDHFGIKPMFYYSKGRHFCFASELKTIAKTLDESFEVDFSALAASMQLLWLPDHFCIFKGVQKLQPGQYLLVNAEGEVKAVTYWELPEYPTPPISEEEAVEALAKSFEESIDRHLVADVEVASFLSGGLDSSLVSTIARRKLGRLKTFTIGMSEADKRVEQMADDQKYAEMLAGVEGFDHQTIVVKPDLMSLLPKVIYSLDEPIGDPAALNTKLICQSARDMGIKVLLSGMGADELHFGYRRQKAWLMAEKYRKLPGIVRAPIRVATDAMPVQIGGRGFRLGRWAKKFLSFAELPSNDAYLRSYAHYDLATLADLMPQVDPADLAALSTYHDGVMRSAYQNDPYNKLCQTDIKLFMCGLNLTYTDRASMSASVEVRVPFIDRGFVETSMRMPGHMKYTNGTSKYLLMKVAERYLPREIIHRPKSNFAVPIRSWISGELSEMLQDLLGPERLRARGWFDADYVQQLIRDHKAGRVDNSARIYQLLCVELWAQQMMDH